GDVVRGQGHAIHQVDVFHDGELQVDANGLGTGGTAHLDLHAGQFAHIAGRHLRGLAGRKVFAEDTMLVDAIAQSLGGGASDVDAIGFFIAAEGDKGGAQSDGANLAFAELDF